MRSGSSWAELVKVVVLNRGNTWKETSQHGPFHVSRIWRERLRRSLAKLVLRVLTSLQRHTAHNSKSAGGSTAEEVPTGPPEEAAGGSTLEEVPTGPPEEPASRGSISVGSSTA